MEILLDEAEARILAIGDDRFKAKVPEMKELAMEALDGIEKMFQNRGALTGLPSGFSGLDQMTNGLHPGEMIVVAARPSMGKTAFAMNIAEHVATEAGKAVAVYSLEMSTQQLMQRLLCSLARVDLNKIRNGFIGKHDMQNLIQATTKLAECKMFIDDTPGLSILELRARSRRLKDRHNIELIVIDYLQLLKSPSKRGQENRQIEVAEISSGIKALAKELKIPIIVLAQLNRNPESRTGEGKGRPRLSDLRESAPSNRTPTSSDCSGVKITTPTTTKSARNWKATPSSSSPSSVTARWAEFPSPSSARSRDSRIAHRVRKRASKRPSEFLQKEAKAAKGWAERTDHGTMRASKARRE